MLLEAWANGGKWLWDGFTVRPVLFRGDTNDLAMPNAFSLPAHHWAHGVPGRAKFPRGCPPDRVFDPLPPPCALLQNHMAHGLATRG
jgi:hypothetical protein